MTSDPVTSGPMLVAPSLVVDHLSKSFGAAKAVDDLSFSVPAGQIFGLVGPNGAGKTTTIRMLAGLLLPDAGSISFEGSAPNDRCHFAARLGLVPERSNLYGWMTASEYLEFFGSIYGLLQTERKERSRLLLRTVELESRSASLISSFSHGMRQRLNLARALINQPTLLLLDEPALGLDPQGQYDFRRLIMGLSDEGLTILISSHQLHDLSELCRRFAVMQEGRAVAVGTLGELRDQAKAPEVYRVSMSGTCDVFEESSFRKAIRGCSEKGGGAEFLFEGDLSQANQLLDFLRERHVQLRYFQQEQDLTAVFLELTGSRR